MSALWHRAVLAGGCLLLPSLSAAPPPTAAAAASGASGVSALRANAEPRALARLEGVNRVLEKELDVLEKWNEPGRMSAKLGARFLSQLDAAAGGDAMHHRFESAVAVPAECSEECKAKWKALSEVYAKYFACRPNCNEDVLRDKTAASEGVDDECMKEQKCWEKIEEVVFTKPDAAPPAEAAESGSTESGSTESGSTESGSTESEGGGGGVVASSKWAIERCDKCCERGRATKSTYYKDGGKKHSCKSGKTYFMSGSKASDNDCAESCAESQSTSADSGSSDPGTGAEAAFQPQASRVSEDSNTALGSAKKPGSSLAAPPPSGMASASTGQNEPDSDNADTAGTAPSASASASEDKSEDSGTPESISESGSDGLSATESDSSPAPSAESLPDASGGSGPESESGSDGDYSTAPSSEPLSESSDSSEPEDGSATGPDISGSEGSPGFGDAAPPMENGHCKQKSDCEKGEYCNTDARDSNEHACAKEVAANYLCKSSEMCEEGMVCLGGKFR